MANGLNCSLFFCFIVPSFVLRQEGSELSVIKLGANV